jgi:sugar lactone lactonase YvrE/ABC-type Fe3+ transport system permease subunit
MRSSGWILVAIATCLWIAVGVLPLVSGFMSFDNSETTNVPMIRPLSELLLTTVGWSVAVAGGAMLLGVGPGIYLSRLARSHATFRRWGRSVWVILILFLLMVPLFLPPYLVFFAWWQLWPPNSGVYAWAVDHGMVGQLRSATLYVGLVTWSWPLIALCVAGMQRGTPDRDKELVAIDGAPLLMRLKLTVGRSIGGLALGGLVVFLLTWSNTTCFDLAQIFSLANEARALEALGAPASQLISVSGPAVLISCVGAIVVWWLITSRHGDRRSDSLVTAQAGVVMGRFTNIFRWLGVFMIAGLWILTVGIPVAAFVWSLTNMLRDGSILTGLGGFMDVYGSSVFSGVLLSLLTASAGVIVTIGLALMWIHPSSWVRLLGHIQAVLWLIIGAVPAASYAVGLRGAWDHLIGEMPLVLAAAHLGRYGFVAALIGWWIARSEGRQQRDVRLLEGGRSGLLGGIGLGGAFTALAPALIGGVVAAFALIAIASFGEIPMTQQVAPPARSVPLQVALLNAMHYQRPEIVMLAGLVMLLGGGLAACIALCGGLFMRPMLRLSQLNRNSSVGCWLTIGFLLLISIGCRGQSSDEDAVGHLDVERMFGSPGLSLGQFSYPRAMAIDSHGDCMYVIDKTARIQRIGLDGTPHRQWATPESALGKPTGVSVGPDGLIYVADTHYYQILVYDADGNEQLRFGEYGTGPGQFIYPTDVVVAPDGRLYVAEYGGNDRIQIFSPEGIYIDQFGSFGSEPGQLNRPQSMALANSGQAIIVADSCNHRISIYDLEGKLIRMFGEPGVASGQLLYPYDLVQLPDGILLVCEWGNHRVQAFAVDGTPSGIFGQLGYAPGQLRTPWSIDIDASGENIFVLDSGNERVQVIPTNHLAFDLGDS